MQEDIRVEKAAIKIQSFSRHFFARKKYHFVKKPLDECQNYPLRVIGNDPVIKALPQHLSHDNILLVGTSGLRTLENACILGGRLPKILLIDDSKQVIQFWLNLKKMVASASNQGNFITKLMDEKRREVKKCSCHYCIKYYQGMIYYLQYLCNQYYFERVKRILLHAMIIPQDWADKNTFNIINNYIQRHQYQGVYLYPSNIVAYVADSDHKKAIQILENIEQLNPDLVIHTDMINGKPKNVIYRAKHTHNAHEIFQLLKPVDEPFNTFRI